MRKFLDRLKNHAHRPWFLPLVCLLAFIDLFVIFIPTEGMIITTTLMRPRRWLITAISVTTASACGALVLSMAANEFGAPFISAVAGSDFLESAKWIKTQAWIDAYGFWAVFLSALGPLPLQPVLLVAAIAGLEFPALFFGTWLGRGPKYIFFAYLAAHGEKWIRSEFARHPSLSQFPKVREFLVRLVHRDEPPSP